MERFHDIINKGIDEWIYFFKNSEVRSDFKSKNIQAAAEKLDVLKMSPDKRRVYEKYLVNRASEKDMFESAIEKGEYKKANNVALKMLKKDKYSYEEIADLTGLSIDQIKKLAENEGLDTGD